MNAQAIANQRPLSRDFSPDTGPSPGPQVDKKREIITAGSPALNLESGEFLWNRRVSQLHVIRQAVLVRRGRFPLDQRRNVGAAFRRDVKPVFGDEIAQHHLLLVSYIHEGLNGDAPAIGFVLDALADRAHL